MLKTFSYIVLYIVCMHTMAFSQISGDYRSVVTGNWTSLSTWERFNGSTWATPTALQGYPGQFTGTETVSILSTHTVTIGSTGISTEAVHKIRVENNAVLYLNGSNSLITYFFNTSNLTVVPGGAISVNNKVKIALPTNAVFYVTENGLIGTCNNNVQVWIGNTQYASCAGAPGTIFTFAQLMDATSGGTLNAIAASNSPVCAGSTISLTGNYSGAIGTIPTYDWSVITPNAVTLTSTEQNYSIPFSIAGVYTATLTVTTLLNGMPYANSETIEVIAEASPTFSDASIPSIICNGTTAEVTLTGLIPLQAVSINYSINGIAQTPATNIQVNASGIATFHTSSLTTAQNNQTLHISQISSQLASCVNSSVHKNLTLTIAPTGSWIGLANSEWDNSANWCGGVPDVTTDITILSTAPHKPEISLISAHSKTLTIQGGAQLTIRPGGELTVAETTTNNGVIHIKSSASGDGSFITNQSISGSGSFTVERYLSANTWHLVSSPITNGLSGVFLNIWLRPYDESQNTFGNYIVPTTIPMTSGEGFSVWTFTSETRTFNGTVNNGTIGPISLQKNNEGWNLIGNPYPSAIDWLAPGWTKNNVANAVYVWNNNQYATFINGVGANGGSRYIAMGQGFFVQAIDASAAISFTNSVQVHNPVLFKSKQTTPPHIRFTISGTDFSDETVFYEDIDADIFFNYQYDAKKLYGEFSSPQLYTKKEDVLTAIHAVPSIEMIHDNILYFEPTQEKEYSLMFYADCNNTFDFLVIDLFTQDTILPNTRYSFTAEKDDTTARFICKAFEKPETPTYISTHNSAGITIVQTNTSLSVSCQYNSIEHIHIITIDGKTIISTDKTNIPLQGLNTGLYFLRISTAQETHTYTIKHIY